MADSAELDHVNGVSTCGQRQSVVEGQGRNRLLFAKKIDCLLPRLLPLLSDVEEIGLELYFFVTNKFVQLGLNVGNEGLRVASQFVQGCHKGERRNHVFCCCCRDYWGLLFALINNTFLLRRLWSRIKNLGLWLILDDCAGR